MAWFSPYLGLASGDQTQPGVAEEQGEVPTYKIEERHEESQVAEPIADVPQHNLRSLLDLRKCAATAWDLRSLHLSNRIVEFVVFSMSAHHNITAYHLLRVKVKGWTRVLPLLLLLQSLHVDGIFGREAPAADDAGHQDEATGHSEGYAPAKLGHQHGIDGIEQQAACD